MTATSLRHQTRIVMHSILCGAACFIPIPFLDEWTQQKIGQNMISGILTGYQKQEEPASHILSRRYSNWCLGCVISLFVYPIKKLVRTIAIFLTVKQVVDECEFWLFKGIFIELAIQQGFDFSNPETVRSLKKVMAQSMADVNATAIVSGITAIFKGTRKDALRIARGTFRWARGRGELEALVPVEMVNAMEQLVTPEFVEQVNAILKEELANCKSNSKP